jgi:hypothetical protein
MKQAENFIAVSTETRSLYPISDSRYFSEAEALAIGWCAVVNGKARQGVWCPLLPEGQTEVLENVRVYYGRSLPNTLAKHIGSGYPFIGHNAWKFDAVVWNRIDIPNPKGGWQDTLMLSKAFRAYGDHASLYYIAEREGVPVKYRGLDIEKYWHPDSTTGKYLPITAENMRDTMLKSSQDSRLIAALYGNVLRQVLSSKNLRSIAESLYWRDACWKWRLRENDRREPKDRIAPRVLQRNGDSEIDWGRYE